MFSSNYRVAFSETDPGGILFFAEFFNIAHTAYEQFFESLNLERNYFTDDQFVIPIVHSEADYLNPVKFGDILTIKLTVGNIGSSSFQLNYDIYIGEKIAAKLLTKHVVVSKINFTKVEIPEDLRSELNRNLA